jgi:hypothetical protein
MAPGADGVRKKVTQGDNMLPYIIFYRLIRINRIINIILFFSTAVPIQPWMPMLPGMSERTVDASGAAERQCQLCF